MLVERRRVEYNTFMPHSSPGVLVVCALALPAGAHTVSLQAEDGPGGFKGVEDTCFRVKKVGARGQLSLGKGGMALTVIWSRAKPRDKRDLALKSLVPGSAKSRALAAFYLLANGEAPGAEIHLKKAGELADQVSATFK